MSEEVNEKMDDEERQKEAQIILVTNRWNNCPTLNYKDLQSFGYPNWAIDEFCKRENHDKDNLGVPPKKKEEIYIPRVEIILPKPGRLISEFADELSDVLKTKNVIFYRSDLNDIVEIGEIKTDKEEDKYSGFKIVRPNRFITLIEKFINPGFLKFKEDTEEFTFKKKSISCELSNTLLNSHILQNSLPLINRIFTVPIPIIYNGELTFPKKGYDQRFNSWLPYNSPEIINQEMTIEESKEVIYDIFKEFCFQDKQDYVNAIAGLLTPFLKGIFKSFNTRSPLFVYKANRERAGKDCCAGVTGVLYEGYALEEAPISSGDKRSNNNDELRKKILSAMINGKKRLHFANNKGYINNSVFEALITAEQYSDRVLGKNESLTFPNELDFSISGNIGIGFTPDLINRSRFINLFLDIENANARKFNRPNIHDWIKSNRELILSALFGLVKNWVDNNKPKGTILFSSFPEWANICGGILECAGFGSPCKEDDETFLIGGDTETQDMKRLFEICFERFGEKWIKKSDIKNLIVNGDESIFSYFNFDVKADQTKFGTQLTKFIGRLFSDIKLIVKDQNTRSSRQELKFTKIYDNIDKSNIFGKELQQSLKNIENSGNLGGNLGNLGNLCPIAEHKNNTTLYSSTEVTHVAKVTTKKPILDEKDLNFDNSNILEDNSDGKA